MSNVVAGWLIWAGFVGLIMTLGFANEVLMLINSKRKKNK